MTADTPVAEEPTAATGTVDVATSHNNTQDEEFRWTSSTVLFLIEAYRGKKDEFLDPRKKKKDIWEDVAQEFHKHGYNVPWECIEKKWRNMRGSYRKVLESNRRPGSGKRVWEYFQMMHEVLADEYTTSCDLNQSRVNCDSPDEDSSLTCVSPIIVATTSECCDEVSRVNPVPTSQVKRRPSIAQPPWVKRMMIQQRQMEDRAQQRHEEKMQAIKERTAALKELTVVIRSVFVNK